MLGIILKARFRDDDPLATQFRKLMAQPDEEISLLEAAILVAKIENPRLDEAAVRKVVAFMTESVAPEIIKASSTLDKLLAFKSYFFDKLGFIGNEETYYDTENSCINEVLVRRKGLPILLSVLCIEIGQRCGLPLFGVGLPGHFVVKYQTKSEEIFLDPFHGGTITQGKEMRAALAASGQPWDKSIFIATSHTQIIYRMLANLLLEHTRRGDIDKISAINRYIEIVVPAK